MSLEEIYIFLNKYYNKKEKLVNIFEDYISKITNNIYKQMLEHYNNNDKNINIYIKIYTKNNIIIEELTYCTDITLECRYLLKNILINDFNNKYIDNCEIILSKPKLKKKIINYFINPFNKITSRED